MLVDAIKDFLRLQSAAGILLVFAAILAMLFANSGLDDAYQAFLKIPVAVQFGQGEIAKPLLLWVNDGLMAVFFFLVGLEIKREILEGELSSFDKLLTPTVAAIGGIVVPAAIYSAMNWGDSQAMKGWAIPAATDIAFSLGVLSLLGKRVPTALKVFLVSLAIIDDIAAIIIIALFYTSDLSTISLLIGALCLAGLFMLNKRGVYDLPPYLLLGLILWVAVLKSGVHATLAGIVLALFIPLKNKPGTDYSPLRTLEHDLHGSVSFAILPLFAFVNAGVVLDAAALRQLSSDIPMGILLGLFIGKPLGIFGFSYVCVKLGLVKLNFSLRELFGVSILCGIGFTMSLFISSLAFEQNGVDLIVADRLGILVGSFLSAIVGYVYLFFVLPRAETPK